MPYKNKQARTEYIKQYYLSHRSEMINRAIKSTRLSRIKKKRFIKNFLKKHPCVDCGNNDFRVLDFDHVKGIKLDCVSRLVNIHGRSLVTIIKEIGKCEVRCANCHRIKTYNSISHKI
jgi:hypothetical protein